MTTPISPPPDLRARVLEAARREPSPPRRVVSRAAGMVLALGFVALAAVFLLIGGADTTTRPRAFLLTTVGGWTAIALAATWAGVLRGRSMIGRSTPILVAVAAITGPALYAWMALGTTVWPGTTGYEAPLGLHLACFMATIAMAAGPLASLVVVRRGTDPIHPRVSGAALGAAAGAWAGVMIDLHCPVSDGLHVAFAHVLPIALLAALGAVIGARLLGIRAHR